MNTNKMDKQEKSIAEKLNQLTNITTFWDDVRKHTAKSMSTATMRKWEYLADRRYAEILTGVEDVRAEVEEYGKPMRYYAPDGKEVFPKSTEKRSATKCKDSNGKEILTGMIIRISNAANKSDNGLFFVAESPCDLSWKNQTVHVLRKIDEYGVELNYVSFYPLISFDENGNEITLHSDAEIVEITDTGFSEISQYFINKKMQANIKWNHTLSCFETLENLKKRDEEILFYSEVIENIKNGFAPTTEKHTNTEEQPTMENPIEEPAPVAENSIDINAFLKKFNENYEFLYEHHDNVAGYSEALESGNAIIASGTEKSQALIKAYIDTMHDFISSDREIAALAFTLDDLGILDEYLPTVEKSINKKEQPKSKGESIMNENKNNTMPNGNHLDINGKEITTGAVVEIRNAYFKADNGLYFVEHSPSDPTWSGTSHSLSKLCRNGKISVTKYSTTFYPLATFTNSREKRIEAAEHNSKYAEIEIVDFSNMENIIAHFNEELAQQRKTSQRNMWHYGENSDMCSRDKEIEEFLQSVIDRISGKSKIIDDNDITSMHNTENLAAETSVTEQPTTENIVYPFILIDTPTAQPETAEEKTVEEQPAENPTVETPASYEKCERFIKEQLTEKGGMYTELFWDLAEKSGLWVRGTFGTPMSKALCNLTEVENVMHNGKIAYSVFKLKVPYHETPEEKSTFFSADLAGFIANRTLAYDEREDMAYPLFEKGYTEKHKPSEKALFGYHLSEIELYTLAEKYHNGEDINVELAKKLLNHGEEEIEIVFDNGKITDKTYHFKKEMCRKLHTEYVENGVDCRFGESDRLITFEEIGKAFIEICRDEYNDILEWREQEDSSTENQTAEPPIETITVEDTEIAVEKIPEVILEYRGDSEKLAILKDKALSLGASVSSTENHLTIDTYENHRPEIESVATELGLKTDEEMHETFSTVQGKINEVGTIEQKNIIYKIPWGIYRRYSAEDIINMVLAKTNDILAIKTENRLKAVSALIDSVAPMTTDKLISNSMEKSGATAEQIAQAKIAIQYIGSPDKLNDYVCSTEENSADNSTVNGNNTTAEQKIRPPPFLKDFPKIRKEKR